MDKNQEYLNNLRHSCAHLLAAAVKDLFPGAHNAIGPSIENGFYQDFDMGKWSISEADLPKIEKRMRELLKTWGPFEEKEVTVEQALKDFARNPYKVELIHEFAKQGKKITENDPGNFLDLCKGGHSQNPKEELINFKLLSIAGAYWRGDEKKKMLTRIYGTLFPTKEELEKYLCLQEEAKKRDHRKLGKDLDLFVFSDMVGKGLPLLTEKGSTIRRILERFTVDEEIKRGYKHVLTPPLAKVELYKKSGHYPYYKETMYPIMKVDDEELILRPMTCPHHFMLYQAKPRSYKELPIRYAEISPQFRYEKSGELTGLIRVRTFILADAHIITPKEKASEEIIKVLELIDYVNEKLGLIKGQDYRYRLSLGDRTDSKKYYKDDKAWNEAEQSLRSVLLKLKAPYFEAVNEAAFYGPKIDIQMKNVNGKEESAFTVQYDFVMPKRFNLKYTDNENKEIEPVVIHRSSIGCFERTLAFLIEHYAGAFPLWLSPTQVAVLPISDKQISYSQKIKDLLEKDDIRVELNSENKTIGAKIRESSLQKVPYMIIIGNREVESLKSKVFNISVRTREGKDLGMINLYEFIENLKKQIEKFL